MNPKKSFELQSRPFVPERVSCSPKERQSSGRVVVVLGPVH